MQVLDEVFAQRTRREWAEIFAQRDVWWAPVNSIDDLLSDPQVAAAGAFVPPAPDHGEEGDPPRTLATLVDFGASPVGPAGPPPELGEHTDAVLRSIGIDERELGRLRREGWSDDPAGRPAAKGSGPGRSERPAAAEEEFVPLGGIRVADFSTNMAGPYATMILAQFGADVVKVESPGGDDARAWPPVIDGGSLSHRHVNAGKRGIVVDLKAREGREVALALAGGCDVLLQSMRPGVADRIGIRAGEDPRASGAVGRNGPGRHGLQPRPVPGRERAHHRTAPGAGRLGKPDRGALPVLPCPPATATS